MLPGEVHQGVGLGWDWSLRGMESAGGRPAAFHVPGYPASEAQLVEGKQPPQRPN